MHEVLVNRLGGLSLPRKSVVRLTDRPNMTLDVYRGRKTTMQQLQKNTCDLLVKVLSVTIMKYSKLLKTFNRQKIRKIFTITSSGFHTPRNSKMSFLS